MKQEKNLIDNKPKNKHKDKSNDINAKNEKIINNFFENKNNKKAKNVKDFLAKQKEKKAKRAKKVGEGQQITGASFKKKQGKKKFNKEPKVKAQELSFLPADFNFRTQEIEEPKKTKKGNGKNTLKVRFLGGVGEIGKNMTVLEYGEDIIVIDAGLTFPSSDMPGVDLVIPDIDYLVENKDKIRGIVITHGHEDHIGALPYVLKDLDVPVFGTKLTLTLIDNKIRETNLKHVNLNCVKAGATIKLGCFDIEFINVNHSIAGAVALSITTPVGIVFHSGDFKIDYTPVAGKTMDLPRISEIGKQGVLLLLAESTNVEREGTTMSETVVKDTLDHVFSDNSTRRLIIATFASNVHRLQQILDLAVKYKRKVIFSGRSMVNIAEAAAKIGELTIPENLLIDANKMGSYRDNEIVVVATGTQGEPMSALTRMSCNDFANIVIGQNDTVVLSSSVIPGNEKMIYGVINNLYRLGAEVIYESLEPIHVSGHACKGELRLLHSLLNPKFFIPVHGEYRHLKKHVNLAVNMGMKESNTLIADIGDTVLLTKDTMRFGDKFKAGSRFVDGVTVDGTDSFILSDRKALSEDGFLSIVVCIEEATSLVTSIEMFGKGFMMSDETLTESKQIVASVLDKIDLRKIRDESELSGIIRKSVKNYIYKATKKNPMIIPVVIKL